MDSNLDPTICRDYLRNVCNRGNRCKFKHISLHDCELLRANASTAPICHDFINGACSRINCKFIHVNQSSDSPQIIVQHYEKNCDHNIPFCKDFLKGQCFRGASCKFRHLSGKDKNIQRIPNNNNPNLQQHQQMTQIIHQPVSAPNPIQSQTTIMPLAASCNGQQLYIKVENQNPQTSNTQNSIIQTSSVPQSPTTFQQYPPSGTFYAAVSGAPHQIHHLTTSMPSAIVDSRLLTTALPGIPVVVTSNQPRQTNNQNSILSCDSDRLTNVIDRLPSVSGTAAAAMAAASVFVQSSAENDKNNHLLNSDTFNQLMPTILNSAFAQQKNSKDSGKEEAEIEKNSEEQFERESLNNDSKNDQERNKRSNSESLNYEKNLSSTGENNIESEASRSDTKDITVKKESKKDTLDLKKDSNSIDQLRSSMAMTAAAVAAVAAAAAVEHHHMQQQNQHSVSSGTLLLQSQMPCSSDTIATITSAPTSISTPALLPSIVPMSSHTSVSHANLPANSLSQHSSNQVQPSQQQQQQMAFIQNHQNPIISTMIQPISESQSGQSLCFVPVQTISSNPQSVLVASSNSTVTSHSESVLSINKNVSSSNCQNNSNLIIDVNNPSNNHTNRVNHEDSEKRTEALIRLSEARLKRKMRHVELLNLLNQANSSTSSEYINSVSDSSMNNQMGLKKNKIDSYSIEEDFVSPSESINGTDHMLHEVLFKKRKNSFRRNHHMRTFLDDYESEDIEEMYFSEDYDSIASPEWQSKSDRPKEKDIESEIKRDSSPKDSPDNSTKITKPSENSSQPPKASNAVMLQSSSKKTSCYSHLQPKTTRQSILCILDSLKNSLKDPDALRSLKLLKRHTSMLKSENSKLKMKLSSMSRQNSELWSYNKMLLEQNIRLRESSKQVVAASRATENAAAAVEAQVNTSSLSSPENSKCHSNSNNCFRTTIIR